MEYLTSKEARVEKLWNKRGIAGLRAELMGKVRDYKEEEWDDYTFVKLITWFVFNNLPKREWVNATRYIKETCGLAGIDIYENFYALAAEVRMSEETMREDIGDDE